MKITAVVTGATSGIGKEIVRGLLQQDATVVIGARNVEKGEAVRAELARDLGRGKIEILPPRRRQHEVGASVCCGLR